MLTSKDPAGALMEAAGYEPSAIGTFNGYGKIPDVFVQDIRDKVEVRPFVRSDTLMTDKDKSIAFARDIPADLKNALIFPHPAVLPASVPSRDCHVFILQIYITLRNNDYR